MFGMFHHRSWDKEPSLPAEQAAIERLTAEIPTRAQQFGGYLAQAERVSMNSAQYRAIEHNASARLKALKRSVGRLKRAVWWMAQRRTYHSVALWAVHTADGEGNVTVSQIRAEMGRRIGRLDAQRRTALPRDGEHSVADELP